MNKELTVGFQTVIGLEVHVELNTKTKIFCGCSTEFGGAPNTKCCPVCTGQPGTLPRLNGQVVRSAILAGLALGCTITKETHFDRKNYFYPDLPKAYQISQLYAPICRDGQVMVQRADGSRLCVGIHELHMEEDAGKLIHEGEHSLIDYNRCGVPLLEIVTEPDMATGEEVTAFLTELRSRLVYLGISDCKLQEGSMRVDVNLSVHREGEPLGTRTEMKNLSSFRSVRRAILAEEQRQITVLASGGTVVQETRRFDEATGETLRMRVKENADDYRYFPEPDILPIRIKEEWIRELREQMPPLRAERIQSYKELWRLSDYDAARLTEEPGMAMLFEATVSEGAVPKEAANWLMTQRLGVEAELPADKRAGLAGRLAQLLGMVSKGQITRMAAKELYPLLVTDETDPLSYATEHDMLTLSDDGRLFEVAQCVVANNSNSVADYRGGKKQAFGYLMGQMMRELKGQGAPEDVRKALQRALGE